MRRLVLLTCVGLISVSLTVAVPSEAASSGSLLVATLDSSGRPTPAQAAAVGGNAASERYLTTNRATRVPAGRYDVLVQFFDNALQTYVIGARRVTVRGATRITFDARSARGALRATLTPAAPAGYRQRYLAAVCSKTSALSLFQGSDVPFRVIPSSLSSVQVAYSTIWEPDAGRTGPHFLSTTVRRGVPTGGTVGVTQRRLARVQVAAGSGPQTGTATLDLARHGTGNCAGIVSSLRFVRALPTRLDLRLPPGRWSVSQRANDGTSTAPRTVAAGRTYGIRLNRAIWGPTGPLPYVFGRTHRLTVRPTMIGDNANGDGTVAEIGADVRTSYRLRSRGKTVWQRTSNGDARSTRLTRTGWYVLDVSSVRRHVRPGTLSTRASLQLRFRLTPSQEAMVAGWLTRFRPAGLDDHNRARPNSYTRIALDLHREKVPGEPGIRRPKDSIRTIGLQVSNDAGRTWRGVPVRTVGGKRVADVRNPGSGFVSLRATVRGAHGSVTTTTVIRGYRIG